MAKKHPHVRCIHILIEGAEEKGALESVAGEEMQTGKEETLLNKGELPRSVEINFRYQWMDILGGRIIEKALRPKINLDGKGFITWGGYVKIESKPFSCSENRGFIADTEPS